MYTHTYTYLGQNRTTRRGKPAAFCAVWVIIAACAPLQKYHYMQMRKWKKLYANVSAGNCMQIRVCVLVVGKREYAKQTTELTTIIRGVTSLRSGLKSIRVKGPWTHGALMKSQNRNVDDTNINFDVAHNILGGMAEQYSEMLHKNWYFICQTMTSWPHRLTILTLQIWCQCLWLFGLQPVMSVAKVNYT